MQLIIGEIGGMRTMKLTDVLEKRGISREQLKSERVRKLKWDVLDRVVAKTVEKLMEVTRVGVVYDVDVDGLVSGKIVEEYIKKKGLMVYRFMNKRKKHGITDDVIEWVKREHIELLYVVDAGTNDIENQRKLSEMGVTVIVLDHHEQWEKEEIENVFIVNCSVEKGIPKLSGAGVCYRYIEELDRTLGGVGVSQYETWVGLTVLSDHCSMLEPENRYYVERLYENYDKIELFQAFTYWGSKRNLFLFGVVPFLNACIRTNHGEWAMEVIMMKDVRKIKKFIEEKRAWVLDEQKRVLEEMKNNCKVRVGEEVVLVRIGDEHVEYSGLTGLLANQISGDVRKSVIVLYKEDGLFKGSFRGYGSITNKVLEECGWKVMGHAQAAGVEVSVEAAREVMNKTLMLKSGEKISYYDFELEDRDVVRNLSNLMEMARFNEMTGGDLDTIKFKLRKTRTPFKENWGKKIEYDFQSFRVRDFNMNRKESEEWIIEPLLDKDGIVLLRQ